MTDLVFEARQRRTVEASLRPTFWIAAILLALIALPVLAEQDGAAAAAANDYSEPATWLCRPGRDDACAVDQTATIVAADASTEVEEWAASTDAPIDCFYVYPTVSLDTTGNSDMIAGSGELGVVRSQLARFASNWRVFAPLYRQFTLTALRARISGDSITADRNLGYNDVLDAWNHYLAHDNGGRGVVLIGHSQGSGVLSQLIKNEVDGKPIQDQIVSAMLLGTNVVVPEGRDVGGDFQHMPLCRSDRQTGCIVTYVTFRSNVPPPAASLFGRTRQAGMKTGCTNPAALGGGVAPLRAYLTAAGIRTQKVDWTGRGGDVGTPFVTVPGLLSGECVDKDGATYLEVTVHADPADPRTDDIPGDVVVNGEVNAGWGLHLIDVAVAMGDLVELVGQQAAAYTAQH